MRIIAIIIAPFYIIGWSILHPKLFWEQAKKEWRSK